MFTEFLYHLRGAGLCVSLTEWMTLMEALVRGHARSSLTGFYHLGRSVLVKKESQFDLYDRAFASHFHGIEEHFDLDDELLQWLANPALPRLLSPEQLERLQAWDLDKLREAFEQRMREQKERHDGGGHWIGTGGTSPFGHGGFNPSGIRIGGPGGGRSAVQVAEDRRYRNLRSDRVLDTRQIGAALRRLRRLAREQGPEELDLDATIDKSARQGGEIDLVFAPPRANRIKLLLLMDVGGSMDPHVVVCERLFSAAHAANHFKKFEYFFFHNCIYERLYTDMTRFTGSSTERVLGQVDETWSVVLVGDAWMSPYELSHPGGAIYYGHHNRRPGMEWLRDVRSRCPKSVWLNPEPHRVWEAPSVRMIRQVFPMFPLTIDGITEAVDTLRGSRANEIQALGEPIAWI